MNNLKCREKGCGEIAKTRAGLAAHLRWTHNLSLDGTQWRAAKKNKPIHATANWKRAQEAVKERTNSIPVNSIPNTAYSIQPPSNPIRHLETAAAEIDARLKVIDQELANAKRLEVERGSLVFQLGQIEAILSPSNQTTTPAQTVRELAHA